MAKPSSDVSQPVRHEADLARAANERVQPRPAPSGVLDPYDAHASWQVESSREPVRSLATQDVTLPRETARFVGETETRALQALLHEVRELNERFVGEPQLESFVRINGSPEQADFIARSSDWARRYAAQRLARPSTRDAGCPYRRFVRLWQELLPFIDRIGLVEVGGDTRSATVAGQFLAPMCDLVAWSFFEGTWACHVGWADDRVVEMSGVRALEPELSAACAHAFGVYRWKASRQIDRVVREAARALADQGAPFESDEDERARIVMLAEDIAEIRPFLVRNFPRAKAIVEIPGGLVAGFAWDTLDRIGTLQCAGSERELLEQRERGVADRLLAIGYDGLLRCSVNWFRDVSNLRAPLPFPALAVGRVVLERVHARLYGFFDKINLEAVCAGWRGRTSPAGGEPVAADDEAVVIAAALATSDRALGEGGRRGGRIASSMRLSELSTLLERHFGCTSRSSKGSELVFYRDGGRHAFVSRHKANPLVPAIAIQRMLRKLGIGVEQWLVAAAS